MAESEASWFDDKERTFSPIPTSPGGTRAPHWSDDVVPPKHDNRTLIVCFDGTGDKFDGDNSNVVQFISMLKKDNKEEQMVYYQSGIGTYTSSHAPGFINSATRRVSKILDRGIAWSLPLHTQAGYKFLMQNYEYGDKICIFGFSRGGYTARALAGMLLKVGLLPADNKEQVPFAYKMYTREDRFGWEQSCAFRNTFSIKVHVDFLGIWDSVNSVGLFPNRLPFTIKNSGIRVYRHAVSLDERRTKFKASLTPDTGGEKEGPRIKQRRWGKPQREESLWDLEKKWSDPYAPTDVLEVWFSGCHCDVGGGAVKNGTRNALARIPLRWMVRQCFLADTGIMFNSKLLARFGIDPNTLHPLNSPRPDPITFEKADRSRITFGMADPSKIIRDCDRGKAMVKVVNESINLTEEEEDLVDILSPINDELSRSKSWWLLEIIPLKHRHQKKDGNWVWRSRPNIANGRYIPRGEDHKIRVHRTVRLRMEADEAILPERRQYTPQAKPWEDHRVEWVD